MLCSVSFICRIAKINGLVLLGPPDACCISFNSNDFDILKIADVMEEMGWKNLNRMQKPACLMIQVGLRSKFDPVQFIDALRAAVEKVKSDPQVRNPASASSKNKNYMRYFTGVTD
jgi:hypothetical protein